MPSVLVLTNILELCDPLLFLCSPVCCDLMFSLCRHVRQYFGTSSTACCNPRESHAKLWKARWRHPRRIQRRARQTSQHTLRNRRLPILAGYIAKQIDSRKSIFMIGAQFKSQSFAFALCDHMNGPLHESLSVFVSNSFLALSTSVLCSL